MAPAVTLRGIGASRATLRPRWLWFVALAALVATAVLVMVLGDDPDPPRPTGQDVYRDLGAWVDVFDYVPAIGRGTATIGADDVDEMRRRGIRTLYLQAAFDTNDLPDGLVPTDLVTPILRRAHDRGINVVAWYAPRFADRDTDLNRLLALARFEDGGERFDGIAVDIEDRTVPNVDARNRRLVTLSRRLRERLGPQTPIGAIVLPTVLLERVNDQFWPRFPWREIAPFYDVWLPMTYWTDRLRSSGYRAPRRLITESVSRMRELTGRPDAPVHPIGGIGDEVTADELRDYVAVVTEVGGVGASIYDYRTLSPDRWDVVRAELPATPRS